jgi:FKBP-type peptidyl-prolyl cis-trans isomerase 2
MLKKKDFIELEYLGKIKETNHIFDLTSEKDAKAHNLYNPKQKYGPVVVCIGQGDVVPGLDEFLENKELKEYDLEIIPEKGFGKKDPKLMKIMPTSNFKNQNIKPVPGLHVDFSGIRGIVKTVSGGRCVIDFNHPLAGHVLQYHIKVLRKVDDIEEKLASILNLLFGEKAKYELKEGKATIETPLPEQFQTQLEKKIKDSIPEIKTVSFSKPKKATTQK